MGAGHTTAGRPRLHSFAIRPEGSPDLAAVKVAARAVGAVHQGCRFTFDEGQDTLPEMAQHLETYDVTTIRASTRMYLLARRVKAMGVKMVLSGEGADEVSGRYLYFHKAPSEQEFHEEMIRKLDALHLYDCLPANKSMRAWGVDPRVPFLDRECLDVAMSMDAAAKMAGGDRMEKGVLRGTFESYLPDSILWCQNERFGDGLGYDWIDGVKTYGASQVSDRDIARAGSRFVIKPPQSREAYFYRRIFEQHFPDSASACTVPGGGIHCVFVVVGNRVGLEFCGRRRSVGGEPLPEFTTHHCSRALRSDVIGSRIREHGRQRNT